MGYRRRESLKNELGIASQILLNLDTKWAYITIKTIDDCVKKNNFKKILNNILDIHVNKPYYVWIYIARC